MMSYKVIPLGEILGKEYNREKIEEAFKKFSCQREHDLEDFLVHKAIPYEKTNYGKTFLCIDSDKISDGTFCVVGIFF